MKQGANTAAEYSIYGSSRVGVKKETYTSDPTATAGTMGENRPHTTVYELTNHLGNVNAVISGLKIGAEGPIVDSKADYYKTSVVSLMDYYPFGMTMLDRQYNDNSYRYGFGGQEEDREMGADLYTAEYWQYDARLGRRWNVDPVRMPWESPYVTFRNNPIIYNDQNGDCPDCKHRTVEGDTYGALAIRYGVSVDQLRQWNKYKDKNIPVGVDLIISDPSVIAKSDRVPGVGDDMGSGNMTYQQAVGDIGSSAGLFLRQAWTDGELMLDMTNLGNSFADGTSNQAMVSGVFNHFYQGSGTPYTNDLLTQSVRNHPSTQRFMYNQIAPAFQNQVKLYGGYKPNGNFNLNLVGNPRFNETGFLGWGDGDEDNGLRITINDVHAYQVRVVSYQEIENNYHAIIELTLYDHFGLNASDFTEHSYASFYGGFYSWYVLQWQRGYKPFVTTIPIQFYINGTLK